MEAERRQIAVLFTDMVGFTTFAERAGEEAAFALMGDLYPLMDDVVREQGGVVQDHYGGFWRPRRFRGRLTTRVPRGAFHPTAAANRRQPSRS
jgi:hypothetical protein